MAAACKALIDRRIIDFPLVFECWCLFGFLATARRSWPLQYFTIFHQECVPNFGPGLLPQFFTRSASPILGQDCFPNFFSGPSPKLPPRLPQFPPQFFPNFFPQFYLMILTQNRILRNWGKIGGAMISMQFSKIGEKLGEKLGEPFWKKLGKDFGDGRGARRSLEDSSGNNILSNFPS